MREAYRRGRTNVDNQICVGTAGNGATVKRVSKNVVELNIRGDKVSKTRYEPLTLRFKVGRCTSSGLFQIIFDDVTGTATIHYPKVQKKTEAATGGTIGLDKGLTEVFADSQKNFYGEGLSKITNEAADKRNIRGKARNKLYQVAMKTGKWSNRNR